ncbi:MAG: hypothetical protein ACJAZ9_000664, partial [Neolewinella sp.]
GSHRENNAATNKTFEEVSAFLAKVCCGLRGCGLRVAWLRVVWLRVAWLRVAWLRVAWLRVVWLRVAWLRVVWLRVAWLRVAVVGGVKSRIDHRQYQKQRCVLGLGLVPYSNGMWLRITRPRDWYLGADAGAG